MSMKVIFVPNYSKNPYQRNLVESLSKQGVNVNFGITSSPFSVLLSVLKQGIPEILHFHWLHPFLLANSKGKTILKSLCSITELFILRLLGIKIVWTVHNIVNHEEMFPSLELFFTKLATKFFNRIIVHCQFAKNEVGKVYGITDSSKLRVIPHGNYINNYKNTIDRAEDRSKLKITGKEVVFLYFGLIRSYKGLPELIEAFKRLSAPQTKLLMAGRPYNNEIAEDILKSCNKNENIKTFFKFIPDDEIQIYMNAADVVVLPYRDVLTSGSIMLAMSFGKPVIAPAIGCMPDVLDSEGNILYDPSDDEGLLKAMRCALNADLGKMGKHNFKLAEQLSWGDIGKCTYEVYQECLTKG